MNVKILGRFSTVLRLSSQALLPSLVAIAIVTLLLTGSAVMAQSKTDKLKSTEEITQTWKSEGWELEDTWKPVVDPEAVEKWGQSVDKAVEEGDFEGLQKLVDFDQNFAKVVGGNAEDSLKKGFIKGANKGVRSLLKTFCDPECSYVFRRVELTEFGPNALMRLVGADGSCNYHFWRLLENEQGELRGVDIYITLSGEPLSDTMRKLFLLASPKDNRNFLQKMMGTQKTGREYSLDLAKFISAARAKEGEKTLAIYDKLPNKVKNDKFVLLTAAIAASGVDDEKYAQFLGQFRKKFPDDVAADLAGVDFYFMKNDFDQMQEAIDRIEVVVGQDAHMKLLKSVGYMGNNEPEKAIEILQQAVKIEPEYEDAYWSLLEIALDEKKHSIVTDTLMALAKGFGVEAFGFENELYDSYRDSPECNEFQAFLKQHIENKH